MIRFPASGPLASEENTADTIAHLVADDLARFHERLKVTLEPQAPYLTEVEHALYTRGKKLRPMLLMLCARMVLGPDTPLPEKAVNSSVSLEMLHVATLIHDDIVDDAMLRRGLPSVNAARGPKTAILVGDLQFVQAIRGFVDTIDTQSDMGLVKLVLDTAFRICCGELDELRHVDDWSVEVLRPRYLETIDRKTAVLFGLACEAGVTLAGGHTGDCRRAGFYGRRIGRAFQIMDDLLDVVQDDAVSGKSRGQDLAQRRLSLPIIEAIGEFGPDHLVSRIMRGADYTPDQLAEAIDAVRYSKGFRASYAAAREQALEAIDHLQPFPRNRYREALEGLAHFIVDRSF